MQSSVYGSLELGADAFDTKDKTESKDILLSYSSMSSRTRDQRCVKLVFNVHSLF